MGFEMREWRALAVGWALGCVVAIMFGVGWGMPLAATGAAMATWAIWR